MLINQIEKKEKYMNKKLWSFLIPVGFVSLFAFVPSTVTSCFWDTIPKKQGTQDSNEDNPNPSTNPAYDEKHRPENFDGADVKEWNYNGKKYLITKEDKIDRNRVFYADLVLTKNAEDFIKLLPKYEDYKAVKNLDDVGFPTFATASQFIRSLDPFKRNLIWISKNTKKSLDPKNFSLLVKKVLSAMENQRIPEILNISGNDSFFNQANIKTINNAKKVFMSLPDHESKSHWAFESKYFDGSPSGDYNIPYDMHNPKGKRILNINGKLKKAPSVLWKLLKDFSIDGAWETNPHFLYREFWEEKLDAEDKVIDFDMFDYDFINKAKVYGMQLPLWNMLFSYLKLLKAFTNSINIESNSTEKDINENGSIVYENKSLRDNFFVESVGNNNTSIYSLITNFELNVLEYMKLKNLMGFTAEVWNSPNLQMFPGGANYQKYETDYRDAYAWAHYQYHNFIQPLKIVLDGIHNVNDRFRRAFNDNSSNMKYYEMIWDNIKFVDNLDRPRVISSSEAQSKFNLIVKDFGNKFGWKYK